MSLSGGSGRTAGGRRVSGGSGSAWMCISSGKGERGAVATKEGTDCTSLSGGSGRRAGGSRSVKSYLSSGKGKGAGAARRAVGVGMLAYKARRDNSQLEGSDLMRDIWWQWSDERDLVGVVVVVAVGKVVNKERTCC